MRNHQNALLPAPRAEMESCLQPSEPSMPDVTAAPRKPARTARSRPTLRNAARSDVDRTLRLAEHLPDHDKAIIRLIYEAGRPIREVGAVMNLAPRKVRERVRRILRRINSDLFRFVLRSRANWSDELRHVARLIVIEGRSNRAATDGTGLSLYTVRQAMTKIRFLHARSLQRRATEAASGETFLSTESCNDHDHHRTPCAHRRAADRARPGDGCDVRPRRR